MLTLMSSFAQEESRSISENIKWGMRKRFSEGFYGLAYLNFMGYGKGEESLEIVPEEAEIIRYIYKRFLIGDSQGMIARQLTWRSIPSPMKRDKWSPGTITGILKNEKYYGAALLPKMYTEDFLTKRLKPNKPFMCPKSPVTLRITG